MDWRNGAFDMSFDFSHIRLGFDEDCTWHKRKSWKLIDIRKCFTEDEEATKDNGWVPVYLKIMIYHVAQITSSHREQIQNWQLNLLLQFY